MSPDYRDKEGNVYKENFLGNVEKEWDIFAQQPARDKFETEQHPSKYAEDGAPLFRRKEISPSPSSSTGIGLEGILALILVVIFFAAGIIFFAIALTPVIAPILLYNAESERKKGKNEAAQKSEDFGILASIFAIIIVLLIAVTFCIITWNIATNFSQSISLPILRFFFNVFALLITGLIFFLLFVTGIAPTALIYLNQKEKNLIQQENFKAANQIKKLYYGIVIIAATTVFLAITSVVLFVIISVIRNKLA